MFVTDFLYTFFFLFLREESTKIPIKSRGSDG